MEAINNNLVNEALASVIQSTTLAKDFILSEAPVVVEQLITYTLTTTSLSIFVAVLIISIQLYKMRWWEAQDRAATDTESILYGLGWVASAISVIIFLCNVPVALKLWLAPKIWLIEYAADLVK